MKFKLLAGAALAAVCACTAASADPAGWYGAIDAGAHFPQDVTISDQAHDSAKLSLKTDWLGFARVGYRFDPHWRLEVEGGYRPSKLKGVTSFDGAN